MLPQHEQLPSGKRITRQWDAMGQLTCEMHVYGAVDIALTTEFRNGVKAGETYIVKNRAVSRARYERARAEFPDMPLPDASLEDWCGEVVKAAGRERRQQRNAAGVHKPDPETARQIDSFCGAMMQRGQRENAARWIQSSRNTLGELSHAASRRLVARLLRLGCKQIHACGIDYDSEGLGNTGHMVVELPDEGDRRKAILREIGRVATAQGYSGDLDHGQQYAYVKLD